MDNAHALVKQFLLDLRLILCEGITEFLVFRILFNGADGTDRTSLRSDEVLETNREQVSLIDREVLTGL
jgi:hypothetical protein